MKSTILRLVGLAVLLLAVLFPALTYGFGGGGPDTSDETTITEYDVDYTLASDGDLAVRQTITVDFPFSGKHGIFEFFDRVDPSAPHARRIVEDLAVTRDGRDEPFETSTEDHGRYTVAKIGSADRTLDGGEHVYVIRYRVPGVIEPGTDGHESQWYWNVVPGGWAQSIDHAVLTVHLPAAAQAVQCARGVGATGGCSLRGEGTRTLRIEAKDLPPRTPVTVKVGLDIATPPAGHSVPWTPRWDGVLSGSLPVALVILGIAALAGTLGWWLARRTHEDDPAFPLFYAPPDGIGPAQGRYLLTERVGREAFVASILQAGEKGAVKLERQGEIWTMTDQSGQAPWDHVDPVTRQIGRLLSGPGTRFTASKGDVAAGLQLKERMAAVDSDTKAWAKREGLMVPSGLGGLGGLSVVGAVLVTGYLVFTGGGPGVSALALVPGLYALGAAPLLMPGATTRRTAKGRDLWSRVGGFRRVLSTPSSEDRFDFGARKDLYTAYIPWAVAFGCADAWADKYRTETGQEPPAPGYFAGGYYGGSLGSSVSSMVDDFDSTLSGAISSYEATQSSSSSGGGGGGFSGGGGGGGGGGGSW